MALFKIFRGPSENLKLDIVPKQDGYCYFTLDDQLFYIAYDVTETKDGESVTTTKCEPLNSNIAEAIFQKDENGDIKFENGIPLTRPFVNFLQVYDEEGNLVENNIGENYLPTTLAVSNAIKVIQGYAEDDTNQYTLAELRALVQENEENIDIINTTLGTLATKDELKAHVDNKDNPHNVTKEQIGLGNVDNTSDEEKPLSNAQIAELATKMDTPMNDGVSGQVLTKTEALYEWADLPDGTAVAITTYTKSDFSLT